MLAISFFGIIFSSLLWLIVAVRFIGDNLRGISFFDAGGSNVLIYVLIVCIPILLMWLVFALINQYLHNRNVNLQLQKLFGQMKRNQDYSDLLARVMIETEQQVKDGFILGKFDLLVADMNELLAEIIRSCNLASNEQIERLWNKVQNGGKWSFGKVIIEVNNAQPNFQMRIYEKACHDTVLAGTIMEFCARYLSVVNMLEKHDKERTFLNIIETGVMGKVFSIFAPISDEVRRVRDGGKIFSGKEDQEFKAPRPKPQPAPKSPIPSGPYVAEAPKKSLFDRINIFKNFREPEVVREEAPVDERDPFSMALERSFGEPTVEEDTAPRIHFSEEAVNEERRPVATARMEEPHFEISLPEEPAPLQSEKTTVQHPEARSKAAEEPLKESEEELLATQKTLNNLRKEWASLKADMNPEETTKKVSQDEDGLNPAYPFGGWTDEQNYHK